MVGKYEFESKEEALEKIVALGVATDEEGNDYPTHKHAVVHLGNLVMAEATYDDEGEELTDVVMSTMHAVDVLWNGLSEHPEGWADSAIVTSNPKHSFLGVKQ